MTISVHVMARLPVPGRVKTRLTPYYAPVRACLLHRAMVWHTLQTVVVEANLATTVWLDGGRAHPFCQTLQRSFGVDIKRQRAGGLGRRMAQVLRHACTKGQPALLLGSDLPELHAGLLLQAADALNTGSDAVFVPTQDGGYGLIGLARFNAQWFAGINWGAARVMQQTERQARRLRMKVTKLDLIGDVDTPRDAQAALRRHAWLRHSWRGCQ